LQHVRERAHIKKRKRESLYLLAETLLRHKKGEGYLSKRGSKGKLKGRGGKRDIGIEKKKTNYEFITKPGREGGAEAS